MCWDGLNGILHFLTLHMMITTKFDLNVPNYYTFNECSMFFCYCYFEFVTFVVMSQQVLVGLVK